MNPISVVIPYLDKGKNSNELRFALRSIEEHLTGFRDIYVVGDLPVWIQNVKHIECKDSQDPHKHEHNIYRKQVAAWESGEVSDTVLHLHSDHYLLKDYDAASFPYYTHRSLLQGAQENQGAYRTTLIRTDKLLRSMLLGTRDFDCHCPIIYERDRFLKAFDGVEWRDYGYAIKSVYANYWEIEGVVCTDLKLTGRKYSEMKGKIMGRDWFSTGNSNPMIEKFLTGLFPLKSKYER